MDLDEGELEVALARIGQLEATLERERATTRAMLDQGPYPSVVHVDGVVVWANSAAAALAGVGAHEAMEGLDLLAFVAPEYRGAARARLAQLLAGGGPLGTIEIAIVRADGSRRTVESSASVMRWEGRLAVHVVFWDITTHRDERDRLGWEASHDSLTGLLSRRAVLAEIDDMLRPPPTTTPAVGGCGAEVAVWLLDLDGFKALNDTFGHATGDLVLTRVGARLADACEGRAVVGRLGGDEFLVAGRPAPGETMGDFVATIGIAIDAAIDGAGVAVSASSGTAIGSAGEVGAAELLAEADRRMYSAKRAGGRRRLPG